MNSSSERPTVLKRAHSDSELFIIRRKRVQFGSLKVDEFAIIIGDAVPRNGPPIALESKAIRSFSMDVDDFEATRPVRRRALDDMQLDSWQRTRILFDQGHSPESIAFATSSAESIRLNREQSSQDEANKKSKLRKLVVKTRQTIKRFFPSQRISAQLSY